MIYVVRVECSILSKILSFSMVHREGGLKSPVHFHCILHAKRGEVVQIACKIAYILNGTPQTDPL